MWDSLIVVGKKVLHCCMAIFSKIIQRRNVSKRTNSILMFAMNTNTHILFCKAVSNEPSKYSKLRLCGQYWAMRTVVLKQN